ncbi:PREDICTED: annexin D2-like [Prunus mume]|uniref:Annexin D2-like n=1 Tax=Prunus mume TaxID=102107 RepID=A0ABM0PBI8_PRUMU|nr:PREDICTED: annexin D2-like [Prunus mume]XP_016650609.1 PREDICTED: annexin D2-like [Prunus mume]
MATFAVPQQIPPVAEDCERLRKAMQGWGTDENAIISILTHRNARQRCLIRQTYAEKYGEDFFKPLQDELSGDFLRAVLLWTPHPAERDALLANEVTTTKHSAAHNHLVIMEIACTRTSRELFQVREDYHARYKRSIEEDIAYHTTGDFRKLLVPLASTYRYEGAEVDMTVANSEANILQEKISEKAYNHDELIRILTTRSKAQLNATFEVYNDQFGHPINKDLKKKPKDEYLGLVRATIKCLTCPEKYYEKALRLSMKGLGTTEETLTRVVATRAEVDMKSIMEQYQLKNSVPLVQDIKSDTSGDYLATLLALVGQ